MRVRSFVAWVPEAGKPGPEPSFVPGWYWRDGELRVGFEPRDNPGPAIAARLPALTLGDDSEAQGLTAITHLAGGVPIRYDRTASELVLTTSITGQPPLFLYRGARCTAVASDPHLLRSIPGVRLELDEQGVAELGHIGFPVARRTLFRDVELVPPGGRLRLGERGASFEQTWHLEPQSPLPWPEFIEKQVDVFLRAMERIDVAGSFLSLTAGLDTRTIFSALAQQGRLIPAATMTGVRRSLDARVAERLCRSYGIPHHAVILDDTFRRNLTTLVEDASRLSAGGASLDQAYEVHMYRQLGGAFGARLSGNVGNQVARGGNEGISKRGADLSVLAPSFFGGLPAADHWLLGRADVRDPAALICAELPIVAVGNYLLGSHFAVQQSPYCSRELIETMSQWPGTPPPSSRFDVRLRDLKHRFVGDPATRSFQRTLVTRAGGFAASCPINWGWRPEGSVSGSGLALGLASFCGMSSRKTGLDDGLLGQVLGLNRLAALHDFRETRRWLRDDLREYALDLFRSSDVRDAGVFELPVLDRMLDDHFRRGVDHHATVTFALDVALARRQFCA